MKKIIILIILFLIISFGTLFFLKKNDNSYYVYKVYSYKDNVLYKEGTAFVYKIDNYGYLLTNYHVIENCDSVYLLIDDEKISANVFNYDEYEDIAIIYIDSKYINSFIPLSDDNFDSNVYVEINTSDNVINGELLSDIMPLKIHYDDTYKILELFKLNANILEGNSGSPVINDKNEIIGMVSMIDVNTNSSYAIPSSSLLRIIDYLENGKYILNLGFDYENYDNDFKGVIINNVISGSEADLAGMISGDIILSINNIEIVDVLEFNYYLSKYRDKNLVIKYYRDGSYYDTVIEREV